ncbi:hypothetical protein GCM10023310_40410 [Paenibacillus vulneris]
MLDKELLFTLDRVPKGQKDIIKNQYIEKFFSTNGEYYENYVNVGDGYYLWCCFKQQGQIYTFSVEEFGIEMDRTAAKDVFLFWDHHILPDLMDLGRKELFTCSRQFLIDNVKAFPRDFYVFDNTLEWTIIMTHEYQNETADGDNGFVINQNEEQNKNRQQETP